MICVYDETGNVVENVRAHVLEGSVQCSANGVRVSAQLIDARNDCIGYV